MKYSKELRENIINDYLVEHKKPYEIFEEYGVSSSTFYCWLQQNKSHNGSKVLDVNLVSIY